jgi:hypothetical protein
MAGLIYFTLVGLGLMLAAALARRGWRRHDEQRRREERALYRSERERAEVARSNGVVARLLEHYFPFAKAAWAAAPGQGDAKERLRLALSATNAVRLGTAHIGLDALLPDTVRQKHFLALGKSGYGKTTLALHLIQDDLRRGRGVCILGSEAELFRDWLLPMVPGGRAKDVVYFKPADPSCTLTWNPLALEEGEDQALAAGEMFAIFKRAVGETSIGARADAILSSAFGILVGRGGATLWSVVRLLEDEAYRAALVAEVDDPYLRDFWTRTFPEYPAGAVLPLANRLNQFLRMPQLRASLCHPVSSFSIQQVLAGSRILYFDLSGLDPDSTRLVGQAALSKFQLELFRRERLPESDRSPVHVYVDEFHVFADGAEGTWRELLARGRRYGLGLHLFTQHPNQLPRSLQHEIFGNVSSIVALNLSAADAAAVRRELLVPGPGDVTKPVPAEDLVSLPVGEGFARLDAGACALRVRFAPPIARPAPGLGDRIRETSWKTFAAPPITSFPEPIKRDVAESTVAYGVPTAGRGGARHKLLQRLAREWGEARGFQTTVEAEILGGAGRVDVALVRGSTRIAVEVQVSGTAADVAASLTRAFAAEFTAGIVLSVDCSSEAQILERLDAKDRNRVRVLKPDEFRRYLDEMAVPADTGESAGAYQLKVQRQGLAPGAYRVRRRTLANVVATALLRDRGTT